jgi:hypothetical protein
MITFPHQWANSDKDPDIDQFLSQTVVPVNAARTGKWTLTNFTIDGDGYIDASAVAVASLAERWVPGVLEGHLYKVVIVVAATDDDIVITMGGVAVGTISSSGTYTYYVRPSDGSPLKFAYPSGTTLTASITSVVVTAEDRINVDLIPSVIEFSA